MHSGGAIAEVESRQRPMNSKVYIFIGWSGDASRKLAEALREWIPQFLGTDRVEAFLSSKDIGVGRNWRDEIHKKLSETKAGIFCLTEDNLNNNWIHYEAGAIAKEFGNQNLVIPFLFDTDIPDNWSSPLKQYQVGTVGKDGFTSLMLELNKLIKETGGIDSNPITIEEVIDREWGKFESRIGEIRGGKDKW